MNCIFKNVKDNLYKCEICNYEIISQSNKIFRECKSKGMGDTISRITHALGITKCGGCGQRQEILNQMFPYGSG